VKLGFLTVPFGGWLERVARWAKENGFEALEVACWPAASGDARRYPPVTHIDVDSVAERADEIRSMLDGIGIEISGRGHYPNNLHPDPEHRASVNGHTSKVIRAAARLGVPVVNTFVGRGDDGSIVIEPEDRRFEGPEELVTRGFHLARDVLRPYVV
jgi:sugar phosphate isomerase/epimerase